jgi:2TM domain
MSDIDTSGSPDGTDDAERAAAIKALEKRRDFWTHAFAYAVFNAAVWIVWAVNGGGDMWPAWLTGLWGFGLLANAWDVYGRRPITEADIRRQIEHARHQH